MQKEQFRQWLIENAENLVGHANSGTSCPIANWLKSVNTVATVIYVGYGYHQIDSEIHDELPEWAKKFIRELDQDYPSGVVRGSDCLDILN